MGFIQIAKFRGVISLRGALSPGGRNRSQTHSKGFTLIKLMVTLAVAGILLTIAVPSFQEFIASNRISTEANG